MNNAKKAWSQPSVSAVDVKMTMADSGYTYTKSGIGHDSIQPSQEQQILGSGNTVTITFTSYSSSVTVSGGK